MMRARLPAAFALLGCASCFSLTWERERGFSAPPLTAVTRLAVGKSTLADCLTRLGAPLFVEEYDEGMALY